MASLTITRGLPAAGKTTWAKAQPHLVRVNRDDLRRMLHGGRLGTPAAEMEVTAAHHAAVEALLRRGADVVCDDTNLRARYVRALMEIAQRCGARIEFRDFTDVPVEECVRRDALREGEARVGAEVIDGMYRRYMAGRRLPLPVPEGTVPAGPALVPYEPPLYAKSAVLVDLDGTVAIMNGRSPYPGPDGEDRCGEDSPNQAVLAAVHALALQGHRLIFVSGRTEACRPQTEQWLLQHCPVGAEALFMRPVGDTRPDSVVKAEIFDREIRHRYRVVAVFDDRNQVVRMWRQLGLAVFQVADGDF